MSGCSVCQGGSPSSFSKWIQQCNQSTVTYTTYPNADIANSVHTPMWAFVNISSDGSFDLSTVQRGQFRYLLVEMELSLIIVQYLYSRRRTQSLVGPTDPHPHPCSSRCTHIMHNQLLSLSKTCTPALSIFTRALFFSSFHRRLF